MGDGLNIGVIFAVKRIWIVIWMLRYAVVTWECSPLPRSSQRHCFHPVQKETGTVGRSSFHEFQIPPSQSINRKNFCAPDTGFV